MTPLAFHHMKCLLSKEEASGAMSRPEVMKLMEGVHCFEVTQVIPLLSALHGAVKKAGTWDSFFNEKVFLPAPKTWLEWKSGKYRFALLLIEGDGLSRAILVQDHSFQEIGWISSKDDTFFANGRTIIVPNDHLIKPEVFLGMSHVFLAMINTPRIIGREQHMPHRGLERELVSRKKLIGKFPLHAWTEIKLLVSKPTDIDDGGPHEAHLTGERALHFCRAHLRIRFGQLEYVTSHWRGNPALGIKQSRYVLQ